MTKKEYYELELGGADDWTEYLIEHSNLPGPRANLELMQAFVEMGSENDFIPLLDYSPDIAPKDSPEEFLAFCGTVGLGELVGNGLNEYLPDLRSQASDPRWRIREAVAMGLQIIGRQNFKLLESICREWIEGNHLEQRAAAAGICEPSLLIDPGQAEVDPTREGPAEVGPLHLRPGNQDPSELALELLTRITKSIPETVNRVNEDFKILCRGLSYCWSVAVAANPEKGKPVFEKIARLKDPDVNRIVRENLKKKRLIKMDPGWTGRILASL